MIIIPTAIVMLAVLDVQHFFAWLVCVKNQRHETTCFFLNLTAYYINWSSAYSNWWQPRPRLCTHMKTFSADIRFCCRFCVEGLQWGKVKRFSCRNWSIHYRNRKLTNLPFLNNQPSHLKKVLNQSTWAAAPFPRPIHIRLSRQACMIVKLLRSIYDWIWTLILDLNHKAVDQMANSNRFCQIFSQSGASSSNCWIQCPDNEAWVLQHLKDMNWK